MQTNVVELGDEDARCAPRTNLFLSATIRFDGAVAPIRLRDLSSSGAKCEGSSLPGLGASVLVTRGALEASGTIVWTDRRGCGLRFDAPLAVERWMPKLRSRGQVIVDEMIDDLRSDRADAARHCAPARVPAALCDALPTRIAEELAYVCRLLESLGDDLSGEPVVVMRHPDKLQNLDIAAQILGHVARLLTADDAEQAVAAIGMECLRKRLLRVAI